ncbi:MAG TPA: UbiA family prenyltransferase [Candidatus Limnocylindrales bacterium]|nr:UbiA family prenyltransferase [Candidatus Limnocylindrales bacterium]
MVRLTHPFPSALDGLVSGGVALVAGAATDTALRVGIAMTALQLGIGVVNDVVDAPRDAGRKLGKPIPAGLVSPELAMVLAAAAFALGFLLSAPGGALLIALAVVVIAIGLAYDLRLKGTPWSWLPFAVGIPVLPVFGWAGATGRFPPMFAVLVPAAVAAGVALAIANSLVDVGRDREAAVSSVTLALGEGRAQALNTGLLVGVAGAGALSCWVVGGGAPATAGTVGIGCLLVLASWLARAPDPGRRELAWRIQAIGLGALAMLWIGAIPR